jgi:hypothetical protein
MHNVGHSLLRVAPLVADLNGNTIIPRTATRMRVIIVTDGTRSSISKRSSFRPNGSVPHQGGVGGKGIDPHHSHQRSFS